MDKYDVVIIGAATSGAYFARKMAKRGFSVKVIEKLSPETLGTRMDIFHVTRTDINTFEMPDAHEGDPAWAFEFTENHFSSPSDKYNFFMKAETVGLHMHEYVALMVKLAAEAGAEFEYCAAFKEFIFENGHIAGIRYETEEGLKEAGASVVVDCSGSSAVARRALPNGYGIENFALADDDMFYVLLRYAKFDEKQINTFWLHAKSWYAPFSMDETEKIIGTGAVGSYANAERVAAKLDAVVNQGRFELVRTEKGTTPFRRPPYSLVADNFIVAGDAACLTKPDCGEGVTSSMVMLDIAADVLEGALRQGRADKKALWDINIKYNKAQGADFSLVRAFLTKLITTITDDEIEYCFANGIIFNEKFLGDLKASPADALQTLKGVLGGITGKQISLKTISAAMAGVSLAVMLRTHYMNFPKDPETLSVWSAVADRLWKKVGKLSED